ncbi:type VII secretion protein EsaA [Listeria rocourtiae]|uniref:type VII secretion protein EsaA n=1 Tax=Listeria rocourtiae TaxID=647910 RepID=UPI00162AC021|nr:type VII secretion protein EsaA [Listeria rocourtiae]MBC1436439.1 type VII secretion protein EsaA [Listeria rocourtiae]
MKKIKWSVLAFLVLALLLSAGTSYLALEQNAVKKEDSVETKKMSIALVNDDAGYRTDDGERIDFGDKFTAKVLKQTDHKWATTSSGFAENGLKNRVYDMIIFIPTNFSEAAMSMTSENPEKVKITYRISETGNKDVTAEAERAAAKVLEDFNKEIIDVYFASILTNLHGAQDSIKKLVDKEETYGSVYNTNVNSPLSNYTQQFKTVQDYTGMSKDSFKGLQDILKGFGTGLAEGTKVNETYFQSLEKLAKNQEANALVSKSFAEQMSNNDTAMSTADVSEQLSNLKNANDAIFKQFQKMEEERTLSVQVDSVQRYLDTVNEQVTMINTEVTTKMGESLRGSVESDLQQYISNEGNRTITLDELTDKTLNNRFNNEIQALLKEVPNYDSYLLKDDATAEERAVYKELRNVIEIARRYISSNSGDWSEGLLSKSKAFPKYEAVENALEQLKQEKIEALTTWGPNNEYYIYDFNQDFQIEKSQTEGNTQKLVFNLPAGFTMPDGQADSAVWLTKADGSYIDKRITYDEDTQEWSIEMDPSETNPDVSNPSATSLDLKLSVKLYIKADVLTSREDPSFDLFAPISLEMRNIEEGDIETNPGDPESDPPIPPTMEPGVIKEVKIELGPEFIITAEERDEAIKSVHDTIAAIEKNTTILADDVAAYVKPYYKLSALFKAYYGIDAKVTPLDLDGKSLTEYAAGKKNSYYYQFNIEDRIAMMVTLITDNVTSFIHRDLETFQQQVAESQTRTGITKENANILTERLNDTTTQAATMNASVAETLKNVEAWRKASLELLDKGGIVITNSNDEKSATLSLGSEFSGLLSQSKSLADSSKTNLNAADNVYKTFDAIDQQAKNIQNSGLGIVTQAQQLSANMANKLVTDQDFAANFASMMENSRVGDRPNEKLYSFLSSPVEKVKGETIAAGDTFTPYLIVLVCFIVALFTGYVIAAQERKRKQEDDFEEEMALAYQNTPITLMTVGIGLIEGAIIGAISAYFLEMKGVIFVSWMGIIILIVLVFVLVATYLLRQLRMIGMFLLLAILATYLFLTEAVGLKIDQDSMLATIRSLSPLQYIENLLNGFVSRTDDWLVIMYSLIGVAVLGIVVNLFVWHRSKQAGGNDDNV